MKNWSLFFLLIFLAACNINNPNEPEQNETSIAPTSLPEAHPSDLPDLGEAPELSNEVWLNTPEPLRLANLKGQVVLIEMWTFWIMRFRNC